MQTQRSLTVQSLFEPVFPYIQIARPDHWFKNVFMLPGIIVPLGLGIRPEYNMVFALDCLLSIVSICLIASSNYVINEILDAPSDRFHPSKHRRPIPSGLVKLPIAYAEWLGLMLTGLYLAHAISSSYYATMLVLWCMGCVYNIRPIRTKDKPFLDVISEAFNNPLRLCAGWFLIAPTVVPPTSLVISYWAVGCYFMAIKRFSEYKVFETREDAASYRPSFGYYTEARLLISIVFYATAAMLFLGAFIGRYRLELVLSFPFMAFCMAIYLALGLNKDSIVQTPERLYQSKLLTTSIAVCITVIAVAMVVDIPIMQRFFAPSTYIQ